MYTYTLNGTGYKIYKDNKLVVDQRYAHNGAPGTEIPEGSRKELAEAEIELLKRGAA